MNREVVIIGGRYDVCDRARSLGLQICLIQKPSLLDPRALALANRAIITDYARDPALLPALEAMHKTSPFAALISLTEPGLLIASRFAEQLGLPGMPPADIVSKTTDKFTMRCSLSESCPAVNVAAAIGRGPDDIVEFGNRHGWPVIVKPRDGSGSVGVRFLQSPDAIGEQPLPAEFLCEAYIEGREFSVEAFSFGGRHIIFAVTEKSVNTASTANPFVEMAHRLPANINAAEKAHIELTIREFLDALGLSDGPSHTELKLATDGAIKIIETHTRYGGDHIAEMVRLVTGYDIITMAIGWPIGLVQMPQELIEPNGGAAVQFVFPPVGKVAEIYGVDTVRGGPGIHLVHMGIEVGHTVVDVTRSGQRGGFVVAVAPSSSQAAEICEAACRGITIRTEPVP